MKKPRVHVGLRIPVDLNDDLTVIAEQQEISKNLLMQQILRSWVEDKGKLKTATKFSDSNRI